MIDEKARNRLLQELASKRLEKIVSKFSESIQEQKTVPLQPKLLLNEESLNPVQKLLSDAVSSLRSLAGLQVKIPERIRMEFPKIIFPQKMQVNGEVSVSNLGSLIKELEMQLTNLQVATVKAIVASKQAMPNKISLKDPVDIKQFGELLDGIEEMKKGFNLLLKRDFGSGIGVQKVELTNFKQLTPQPVTNININGLRGFPLSSQISVLTTATPLPANNLANRRSMIIYNNSTQTIYLGGSGVTVAAGLPVLKKQYSPPIDASYVMQLYGIAGNSGGADVRVFEVSNDATGS